MQQPPTTISQSITEQAQQRLEKDPTWKGWTEAQLESFLLTAESAGDMSAARWIRFMLSV